MYLDGMHQINYHHLLYFRTVVKEGSIAKACQVLHVSQPAISTQLKTLEHLLGDALFKREGRRLIPTEVGQLVYRYADEIFGLGQEMFEALKGRPTGRPLLLRVGVTDVLPKKIAFRILQPALFLKEKIQLVCHEAPIERLMSSLVLHELDLVLSNAPIPSTMKINGYSHLLGESSVSVLGASNLAKKYRKNFPASLNQAPFLMPFTGTTLRHSIHRWFEKINIKPIIKGEFEDSALLKEFACEGHGLFFVPEIIRQEIQKDCRVEHVGDVEIIKESFYVLSMERKFQNYTVGTIVEQAKKNFFGK